MSPVLSAEGAAFSSHARKAVDQRFRMNFEARRADIRTGKPFNSCRTFGAQSILFQLSTASRPWLLNAASSALRNLALCNLVLMTSDFFIPRRFDLLWPLI